MTARTPTVGEIRSWPVTVDVQTAGRAFGIGRDQAYRLAREGQFPVPVLRLGRYLRVTRAAVLDALGIEDATPSNSNVTASS
jgi:predicted DNA-binding transcriptional regulator AlpA